MVDPYLCHHCLEARFPTAEAREEHFKICPVKLHSEKMDAERKARLEQYYKEHPEKRPRHKKLPSERYYEWWHGKLCRVRSNAQFKRVVEVNFIGPPSQVYGGVELVFEDGTRENVSHDKAFKPRKSDVEVSEE